MLIHIDLIKPYCSEENYHKINTFLHTGLLPDAAARAAARAARAAAYAARAARAAYAAAYAARAAEAAYAAVYAARAAANDTLLSMIPERMKTQEDRNK